MIGSVSHMYSMDIPELRRSGVHDVPSSGEVGGVNENFGGSSLRIGRPHSELDIFHMPEPPVHLITMSREHTRINDDMHFLMSQLFFEDDSVPISNNLQHTSTTLPLLNLPLVHYKNHDQFFSKLTKTIKFQ